MENENPIVKKNISPKRIALIVLIVVAVFGLYGSFYFYNKYKNLNVDATVEAQKETARLVSLLGKLMELPKGETPTVATISDKEKLKDQAFFANAENGDILFAYTTSMKAILYRPSSNKIINVAPISINQSKNITEGTTKSGTTSTTKK
ncbi:hypothetical protein IT399_01195 [Candidatus Nomurabacteria bacterium]|nr:hypothetical protein [Candidatus Nomurabacteria bacterium]